MKNCLRHFKALMRKNFLLWWRTPICSTFELLVPIVMMSVLWIIRVQVPSTSVDQEGLTSKKYTTFRAFTNVDDAYQVDWVPQEPLLQPMFTFANYTEKHDKVAEDYDPGFDYFSMQYWSPSHCIKQFDYNRPKVSSPIIGIIGAQSRITDQLGQFISTLRTSQKSSPAKFGVPPYEMQFFATQQEFDAFISSPDYKNGRKNKGVCFGM